ncbi:protein arginine methyltransferase NDUFAF7, mitochondrial-like [Tubulanus polymorphus]|uniref:protein arginine methyltransferase NDUFAF7, mitochondrial-like n=1 Tax=Tubulanus polymorphus TaxID=672921 RepID=UPI003DA52ECC
MSQKMMSLLVQKVRNTSSATNLIQRSLPLLLTEYHHCHNSWRSNHNTASTNQLQTQLKTRIKASGPLTVAKYMREVLTNPISGYYMHRDVFGTKGDFITSPEISQVFGELIGVWCINEWMQSGSPQNIQLVELGPGRGTLADDILRVCAQFPQIKDALSLHLVEVSPALSNKQAEKLSSPETTIEVSDKDAPCYKKCKSKYGFDVFWYKQIQDVPQGFSFYVAHEFFDALPIHKFQKTEHGWREILIDFTDESTTDKPQFKYVLSPGITPALTLAKIKPDESRDHVEFSPESGVIIQDIANRINMNGGFALVADYGHDGEKGDTFRGFRNHSLHDPLKDVGTADLTADVDFSYLKQCLNYFNDLSVYGPITQQDFLQNMGIGVRLKVLLQKAERKHQKDLVSGCDMLVNPNQMGERFKFCAFTKQKPEDYLPAGFKPL